MSKRWIVLACMWVGVALHGTEGIETNRFPLTRELVPAGPPEHGVAAFELDELLFMHTNPHEPGFRIVDENGLEVPYVVRPIRERVAEEVEVPLTTARRRFSMLPGGRAEMLLERTDPAPGLRSVWLEFQTPEKNFEKLVTVYGSMSRGTWRNLCSAQPIFDYSKYVDFRKTRVRLEEGRYRWFRVDIDMPTEAEQQALHRLVREMMGESGESRRDIAIRPRNVRIEDAVLIGLRRREQAEAFKVAEYKVLDLTIATDRETGETRVKFRTRRPPLVSVSLLTATPNFSRTVLVEGTDAEQGDSQWQKVVLSEITGISLKGYSEIENTILFPAPRRHLWYRLKVRNQNKTPLDGLGVQATGRVWEAVFRRESDRGYRLFYGAPGMGPTAYDVEALESVPREELDLYALGPERMTAESPPVPQPSSFARYALLVALVLVAAIVIFWGSRCVCKRRGARADS